MGVDPKFLDNKHTSCPFCGGKDRYRFDDKGGTGSYICSVCGAGTGMKFIMTLRGWDFARAAAEIDAIIGGGYIKEETAKRERTVQQKIEDMRQVLREAQKVTEGTATWKYLSKRCGDPTGFCGDIRHHPGLFHKESGEVWPCMIAIMYHNDGKCASLHRTFLTKQGDKAPVKPVRKIMPPVTTLVGSAVRLGPAQERLGIAEGIETAICASKLFGLPVWAGISANGLQSWELPEGTKQVGIFSDNDASFTGQAAAFHTAKKLTQSGLEVEVFIPPSVGSDWCDVFNSPGTV